MTIEREPVWRRLLNALSCLETMRRTALTDRFSAAGNELWRENRGRAAERYGRAATRIRIRLWEGLTEKEKGRWTATTRLASRPA